MEEAQYFLKLGESEINKVLTVLGQLPYVESAQLISKINAQAVAQKQIPENPGPEAVVEDDTGEDIPPMPEATEETDEENQEAA